jgi:catechol-2,3-dioxygenase
MDALRLEWPNWIGVVADDLAGQRRFYRDVLGLSEHGTGDGWVHFDMGFPNVLELLQRGEEAEYDRRRYQIGYAVDDIRSARGELIRRGAFPLTEVEGGPESQGLWSYFRDPEGNVFEISQRLGATWDTKA